MYTVTYIYKILHFQQDKLIIQVYIKQKRICFRVGKKNWKQNEQNGMNEIPQCSKEIRNQKRSKNQLLMKSAHYEMRRMSSFCLRDGGKNNENQRDNMLHLNNA